MHGLGRGPAAVVLLLSFAGPNSAQELSLKRMVPGSSAGERCPAVDLDVTSRRAPTDPRATESLVSEATRWRVLGELDRAHALLEEAAALDPTSPELQFQVGWVLDEMGEGESAADAFCRFLALEPDHPDRGEVEARLERLIDPSPGARSAIARQAFQAGIARFDEGDYAGAVGEFSTALVESPEWDDAYFNRGVAYLRAGRREPALNDLARYLEINPRAEDAQAVRAILPSGEPAPAYSPAAALAAGMLVPGLGHFYSGRPWMGALYLAGAGASAAVGLLYLEIEVSCLTAPGPEGCPPQYVVETSEERTYLVPGLTAAAGLTLLGALHAFASTRELRDRANVEGFRIGTVAGSSATLSLRPIASGGAGGLQASVRLRH